MLAQFINLYLLEVMNLLPPPILLVVVSQSDVHIGIVSQDVSLILRHVDAVNVSVVDFYCWKECFLHRFIVNVMCGIFSPNTEEVSISVNWHEIPNEGNIHLYSV